MAPSETLPNQLNNHCSVHAIDGELVKNCGRLTSSPNRLYAVLTCFMHFYVVFNNITFCSLPEVASDVIPSMPQEDTSLEFDDCLCG